jgi:hypothetical protein
MAAGRFDRKLRLQPQGVLFEVFGSPGAVATINYLDEHAQPQRVDDAKLP